MRRRAADAGGWSHRALGPAAIAACLVLLPFALLSLGAVPAPEHEGPVATPEQSTAALGGLHRLIEGRGAVRVEPLAPAPAVLAGPEPAGAPEAPRGARVPAPAREAPGADVVLRL